MGKRLTMEQEYLLRRIALEAQELTQEELISALCDSWAARFQQKFTFMKMSRSAGYSFKMQEKAPCGVPKTQEEFAEMMGFTPTIKQAEEFAQELYQDASMELNMEEIIDSTDNL